MSIEITQLSKRYGASLAVDSVSATFGDADQVVAAKPKQAESL